MVELDLEPDSGVAILTIRRQFDPAELIPAVRTVYEWNGFAFRWLVDVRATLLHGLQVRDFLPLVKYVKESRPGNAPVGKIAILGKDVGNPGLWRLAEPAEHGQPLQINRFTERRAAMHWLLAPQPLLVGGTEHALAERHPSSH